MAVEGQLSLESLELLDLGLELVGGIVGHAVVELGIGPILSCGDIGVRLTPLRLGCHLRKYVWTEVEIVLLYLRGIEGLSGF
jgi:hypothetical protein